MVVDLSGLMQSAVAASMIFARTGAIIMLLPGVGHANVSPRIRLILALFLSLAFLPFVQINPEPLGRGLASGLAAFMSEILVGLLFGLAARLCIQGIFVAGAIVSHQINLSPFPGFDIALGETSAIMTSFFMIVFVTLIFVMNLHHVMILGIVGSYGLIMPGTLMGVGDLLRLSLALVADGFALGFRIAMPFIVLGLVMQAGMGILARLVPQFQIFFVAIPFVQFVGFALLFAVFGSMFALYLDETRAVLVRLFGLQT